MKLYFLGLFLIFNQLTNGQTSEPNFVLVLNFRPSFIAPCIVTLICNQDTNSLELQVYKNRKTDHFYLNKRATLTKGDINEIVDFLKTFQFQITGNKWSFPDHMELINGDSVLVPGITIRGVDGITVRGTFTQNNLVQQFKFWSPLKESENQKFMEKIFSLLDKSFSEKKVIDYIEQLRVYFPFGLGLKKISDNPLKYKLYGNAYSPEKQEELIKFINTLPTDKDVFIDLSRFAGVGPLFYSEFETLIKNQDNIYWVKPSRYSLKQLKEIGVPQKNILK